MSSRSSGVGTWLKTWIASTPERQQVIPPLERIVEDRLAGHSEDMKRIVSAIAGLVACTAYADRNFSADEETVVRSELAKLASLDAEGVETILDTIRSQGARIMSGGDHYWIRDLRERTEPDERIAILGVLIEVAASDGELSIAETNYLRRVTSALGLSQQDYTAVQALHRDKLSTLV